ncbi:hypothetical protein AB0M39_38040 [Streptomyces sp. NPDC051907]|uniref:hypothetical protein n=1 Tax=Streptomyces sp. NPDC051907 TaxID=3155284 RepID=UPI0034428D5B
MTQTSPAVPERRYFEPRVNAKEEPMRRRKFIATVIGATGAGMLPGVLSDAAVAAPDRLSGSRTLPTIITDLAGDIWRTGADYVAPRSAPARADLHEVAMWQWAQAVVVANRAARSSLAKRALSLEAEAARQLAMICADRFDYLSATKLYRLAQGAADRAGDHELTAWIRTSWAYMPLYVGNLERTESLCTTALEALAKADRPGGRAAACAWALKARLCGAQGDAAGVEEALREAYGAMARYTDSGSAMLPAPHHPQRFAWVKLRLATAEAYAALGDEINHRAAHDSALSDPSVSAMHRPMLSLGVAEVAADPGHAAATALAVLRGMTDPPNPVVGRARALAHRAAAKDPRDEAVQSLRVHLLSLTR